MSDYRQPVMLGSVDGQQRGRLIMEDNTTETPPQAEAKVLPIENHPSAWKTRDRSLAMLARQTRVVVKGGARVVKFNVSMPVDQYEKLMARFEGTTPSDKINTIARIANRRLDQLEREQLERAMNEPKEPA